jgi:hypothetical protein
MVRELALSPDAIQIVTAPGKAEPFYPAMLRACGRCRVGEPIRGGLDGSPPPLPASQCAS